LNNSEFIEEIVQVEYPDCAEEILGMSLMKYLHHKTRSVDRGSKARGSFGNLYAIYVLVEDYINVRNDSSESYTNYEGMQFSDAFNRQRELPFGEKLQNHALNHRCNEEFLRYYPNNPLGVPIIRDKSTNRYWFNEKLLETNCDDRDINIASLIIQIIDRYVELKREGFESFFSSLENSAENGTLQNQLSIVRQQLNPEVDARIFEIVSYAILKYTYDRSIIYYGSNKANINPYPLTLYKTGRTNSNDGGIDFIMRPSGQIFQVTEVLDFRKYFLDIDKVNRYPINFVIKTIDEPDVVWRYIEKSAKKLYPDQTILQKYLSSFESIITIPTLEQNLDLIIKNGRISELIQEIVLQCKVEFNIPVD
jgi:hypothetical protein